MKQTAPETSPGVWRQADRALRGLETVAAVLAAVCLLGAMLLISVDVMMRYVLNAPLSFQYYFVQNYLLVGMVLLALPWGFRNGGTIRIEGFVQFLPDRQRDLVYRAGLVLSALYVAALAWRGGKHFWNAFLRGEVDIGVIDWPVYWSWAPVPIGCGLLALRLLITAVDRTAKP